MKKVKIVDIKDFDYTLEVDGKKYTRNFDFYDVKPKIGDYIYVPDKILTELNFFTYGPIDSKENNIKEDDIIKVVSDDKQLYLKRYYG